MTPVVVVALAVALVAGACTSDEVVVAGAEPPVDRAPQQGDGQRKVRATQIARMPTTLTGFDASADGSELLVGDRSGVVRRLRREESEGHVVPVLDREPVLDISDDVSLLGERGFFDLAVTPDGDSLIVNHTATDGAITVTRYPYEPGSPIDPDSGVVLLELPHPYAWHHGGGLAFTDDGDLLVAIGDMEFRNVGLPGPQDPDLILGGILRVPADAVQAEDPTWEPSPRDMIARGLRNPWRISIDPESGDLWIGDVGLDSVEEIDLIPGSEVGTRVVNLGWPYFEGTKPHQGEAPDGVELDAAVHERRREEGVCGMVGGFVYRGRAMPWLVGSYVYSDLCDSDIRALRVVDGEVVEDRVIGSFAQPVASFGEGPDRELYGLGGDGVLYRLDPGWWRAPNSDQAVPRSEGPPPTLQSTLDCSGLTRVLVPLQEFGDLPPDQLRAALERANDEFALVVPTLPQELLDEGMTIQAAFLELQRRFEAVGWETRSPGVESVRNELMAGSGAFEGFPEALATIIDSECG